MCFSHYSRCLLPTLCECCVSVEFATHVGTDPRSKISFCYDEIVVVILIYDDFIMYIIYLSIFLFFLLRRICIYCNAILHILRHTLFVRINNFNNILNNVFWITYFYIFKKFYNWWQDNCFCRRSIYL